MVSLLQVLGTFHKRGRLGLVLFQFPTNFLPSPESRAFITYLRRTLLSEYRMVVEFRAQSWFKPTALAMTKSFLSELGIAVAASDELAHELEPGKFQKKSARTRSHAMHVLGCPTSHACCVCWGRGRRYGNDVSKYPREKVPIQLHITQPQYAYVRVHRRAGNQRLLAAEELADWAGRLKALQASGVMEGPVYFLW